MRVFFCIPLSETLRERIVADRDKIKRRCFDEEQLTRMRWIDPAQYHVTQYFIGDVSEERINALLDAAEKITSTTNAFPLETDRYEFKPYRNPHLLWLRFRPNDTFTSLAHALHKSLAAENRYADQPKEEPVPHVTLIRLKQTKPIRMDLPAGQGYKLDVSFIDLMQSVLKAAGSEYILLQRLPLR